jgi:hypothetical protein
MQRYFVNVNMNQKKKKELSGLSNIGYVTWIYIVSVYLPLSEPGSLVSIVSG